MAEVPDYEFVLYVDEAGDVGLKTAEQGNRGSSEWFALGGVLMSKAHEADTVQWVRSIRRTVRSPQAIELHYADLNESQRITACNMVAELPLRAFIVMSHKENMRGHENERAAQMLSQSPFYNFCFRVLLERVTAAVARSSQARFNEFRKLRIIIARTGGVQYSQTQAYMEYLRSQAFNDTTYLSARVIEPRVLHWQLIEEVTAKSTAGCQVADVVVSSFFNAVNHRGAHPMLLEPALSLRKVMGKRFGKVSDVGLKLLPWDKKIPVDYRPVFENYGYGWFD